MTTKKAPESHSINGLVRRFEPMDGYVWCDIHGCIHDETHDPYDYGVSADDAECGPSDWRKLWAGAYMTPNAAAGLRQKDNDGH